MSYAIRKVTKATGPYPGTRWLVVEDGTANYASHTSEKLAQSTQKLLLSGQAKFCDCGTFVIGGKSRTKGHVCPNTGMYIYA